MRKESENCSWRWSNFHFWRMSSKDKHRKLNLFKIQISWSRINWIPKSGRKKKSRRNSRSPRKSTTSSRLTPCSSSKSKRKTKLSHLKMLPILLSSSLSSQTAIPYAISTSKRKSLTLNFHQSLTFNIRKWNTKFQQECSEESLWTRLPTYKSTLLTERLLKTTWTTYSLSSTNLCLNRSSHWRKDEITRWEKWG